ncbi:hypothetical protein PRIPAC_83868 [Pristionchus pacificus]|uniref:Fibrinogen C-terminal domain-containing protein n=1 Tax=Pristionchus pacificus TaxID=54126 RepID=A0A2A6CCX3_PRIPA|nr:hypothetical protein PRIPAC_83868 [Pristionchus pacificus]|eukprot:PDM75948.1 hypothetical protein PRIPAC_43791 [Pristionchus pacificus]
MLSLSFFIFYALISDATPFILTPAINVDQQWKLVQKREDGSEAYWNRTWNEYKEGFGSEDGSFYWMGLEKLHEVANKPTSLKIEMWDDRAPDSKNPNEYYWAIYTFSIEDENTNYTAHFGYDWQNPQGNATTGWYDMTCNDGVPFSTIDRINDPSPICVTDYHLGGWWLRNCALSSLNGEYNPSLGLGNGYGLFWIVDGLYVINPSKTKMWISY